MRKFDQALYWLAACLLFASMGTVHAQQQKGGSGIVCWKDKNGKTVGCGDKVPLEFQDNATRELNKRGMTVNQTAPALTAEQRQAMAAETERKKADDQKRLEEKRRDRALLDSFTNENEIDLKRKRDIQQIEVNISAQQTNLKNLAERERDVKIKLDQYAREKKPLPVPLQEDYDRVQSEKSKIQAQILQKRQEIVDRNLEYDAMKKRFMELKGITPASAPAPATAAAPAATAAPQTAAAKK